MFISTVSGIYLVTGTKFQDMCSQCTMCTLIGIFIWKRKQNNKDGHDHLNHSTILQPLNMNMNAKSMNNRYVAVGFFLGNRWMPD